MFGRVQKRHLVALVVCATAVALLTIAGAKTSAPYEEAERFLKEDRSVLVQTGAIRNVRFAFWREFRQSGGTAHYSFLVAGEKGEFRARVNLIGQDEVWRVNEVSVER